VRARAATSETWENLSSRIRNWFRDSAKRPRTNSLWARSNATSAADSSWVGCRGGGGGTGAGLGAGLTARAAATFCVFLTLDAATFFAGVFLAAGFFWTTFLVFAIRFGATFFADRPFTAVFFAAGFAAALFALGLVAGLAFTARFAVLADVPFAEDREVDRRKPFVRLLDMAV